VSVEFKARLPLSEQEMCCGYDDLAGPLPETRSVRSFCFCRLPRAILRVPHGSLLGPVNARDLLENELPRLAWASFF
jgi:hypothetical protein